MTMDLLRPQWPAPDHVVAVCSTRVGGTSTGGFAGLNLGDHVGDLPAAVAQNRQLLAAACPGLGSISWLQQVHGTTVIQASAEPSPPADGQYSRLGGLACAIMTADCLPVLFCDRSGAQVAAAHAGWRGLCAGILERTAATFSRPQDVMVWMGPAISQAAFEVGPEVREQFLGSAPSTQQVAVAACFVPSQRALHFMADLYALARLRLATAGIDAVYGGEFCTYSEPARFFSFRREPRTGRMASLIYISESAQGA